MGRWVCCFLEVVGVDDIRFRCEGFGVALFVEDVLHMDVDDAVVARFTIVWVILQFVVESNIVVFVLFEFATYSGFTFVGCSSGMQEWTHSLESLC